MTKLTEAQEEWLVALESGEYKQTRHNLRTDDTFCCLGVACDLSGLGEWVMTPADPRYIYVAAEDGRASFNFLLPPVRVWLSLTQDEGDTLAYMNDNGKTFKEIAAYVRENADTVFTQEEN